MSMMPQGIGEGRHEDRELRGFLQLRHRLDRELGTPDTTTPAAGVAIAIDSLPRPLKAMLTPRRRSSPSPERTALTSVTGRGIAALPSDGVSLMSGIRRAVTTGERSSRSQASPSSIAGKMSNAASTGPLSGRVRLGVEEAQKQVARTRAQGCP